MNTQLVEVTGKRLLRTYIYLPKTLYHEYVDWVPPIFQDEFVFHDPAKNEALGHADVVRYLAFRNDRPVGRVMGIIHRTYNEKHQEKTVRFNQLDCVEDPAVFQLLLSRIESWGRSKGCDRIIGPYGFSDKDPQGYQVEGYEFRSLIAAPSHPPYLPGFLSDLGYQKEVDCVSYLFPVPEKLPQVYYQIAERLGKRTLRLKEFTSKRQIRPYIIPVFRLVNEAYAPLFGFVPMSDTEIVKFANQYLPILDTDFVKIVVNEHDEVVAFVVAMPNMSRGLQRAKGELFPFGFLKILYSMRKANQLDLLLGAVKPSYRGKGVAVLLAISLLAAAYRRGMKKIDSHLILETNALMRAECENLDGQLHKRYRVFQKSLVT
ncbi:MAG: hypothetical protein K1X47_06675 [Cyclobacteriaceae bacterium]|nr:hypothetical protein [Cyclobacteriaceae bacterium]